jgi:hypothetical protein
MISRVQSRELQSTNIWAYKYLLQNICRKISAEKYLALHLLQKYLRAAYLRAEREERVVREQAHALGVVSLAARDRRRRQVAPTKAERAHTAELGEHKGEVVARDRVALAQVLRFACVCSAFGKGNGQIDKRGVARNYMR